MKSGERVRIGDGLFIVMMQGSALKEQELNAQQMDPTKFERLVENISQRGALESLPYCHQPEGKGPISLVSGHHRAKAARMAGLREFPVLVDTRPMPRSLLRAKQIAHNELTGSPDQEILLKMLAEIDSPDDLLVTGLPDEMLPVPEKNPVVLDLPRAEFDWEQVTLLFLPDQISRMEELATALGRQETVGLARLEQFQQFSDALVRYGQVNQIKNMAAVVDTLVKLALKELESEDSSEED